jgi:hypothetical protein
MSSGDLLFIFSFIVLPTIILVSCIWALWLIRAGALLPPRRMRMDARVDAVADERAQAQEHEQELQQAVAAAPITVSSDVAESVVQAVPDTAAQQTIVADAAPLTEDDAVGVTAASEPDGEPEPVTDMTSDLPVVTQPQIQAERESVASTPPDSSVPTEPADDHTVIDELADDDLADSALPAADLDILFVPLDPETMEEPESTQAMEVEREPDATTHSNGARAPQAGQKKQAPAQRKSGSGNRRKPSRRVAQLRPTEEPQPRSTTLKRPGRGNRQ